MQSGSEQPPGRQREEVFPALAGYLRERFGPEASQAQWEPLRVRPSVKEGGYGTPYLVQWIAAGRRRRLILETVKPGAFGHEDRADRAAIVLRALDDFGLLPRHVEVVDAGAFRDDGAPISLSGTGELFTLVEFCDGEPYARDLESIAGRGRLEDRDRERAAALADYLADIHRQPVSHPSYWRRRLRDLSGAGECIAGVADSYPAPFAFVDDALLLRIESLALDWRYRLRHREERLRTIHGDFHPWNILFRQGIDFSLLDRSRGRWGDPADDVAALAINYVFFALRSHGSFQGPFADLFRFFWSRYQERSGDAALAEVIAPHFAFRALVVAHPLWYPGESETTRRLLFRFLLSLLEAPRFQIEELDRYLERSSP